MDKHTIVSCKVSRFDYVSPTTIQYRVPSNLKGDKLYWTLKKLLYEIFRIVYVEIVDIVTTNERKYRFDIGGCIDLRRTINKYYKNVKIGNKRDKE